MGIGWKSAAASTRTFIAAIAAAVGASVACAEPTAEQAAQFAALRAEARAYEFGEGVSKDPVRAQEKYCEAARLGDMEAQYRLGWMYTVGRGGLARDDGLAAFFFDLAAEQGHEQARNMRRLVASGEPYAPQCMREPAEPDYAPEPPLFETPAPFHAATPGQARIARLVDDTAPRYGVNPRLVLAVIGAESNFDPLAVSARNAHGLMQLLPETCVRFDVKDPNDPAQNVRGGISYLRWLLAYYEGDVALALAAYNAGEQTVDRYGGVPPYAETRAYVKRILAVFPYREHSYDARVTEASPQLARIRLARTR